LGPLQRAPINTAAALPDRNGDVALAAGKIYAVPGARVHPGLGLTRAEPVCPDSFFRPLPDSNESQKHLHLFVNVKIIALYIYVVVLFYVIREAIKLHAACAFEIG
jgi:hypothetical protein